ncbi:U-box domain-containing protein 44 [Acorus calamus]|uniref:U-box domain-containing protein 44 n=1 Tax=Acorus calamus TaxID=4465 RepID=A0AAV9C9W5_ACOCL|nr:U-box domain-containing protein 44 [Acorus calamus]
MILIASMRSQLGSEDEQVVVRGLGQLLELCEEDLSKREFVVLENYVPIFVGFLKRKGLVRTRALELLIMLAKDSNENKEIIAKVDNTIELTVRLLAKSIGEGKLAVALLLELSKNEEACNHIGWVQGCILLLVTMLNSDNAQAANDAKELLENLSFSDQNVVQMAKANYFTPLLQRITSGSEDVKLSMVTALSKMELTDHSKADLFENGVLPPLLHMIENGNTEIQIVAGKSLQNLSSLPKNGLQMIRDGAVRPLLHLVYHNSITSSSLQEQTAAIIMNLAISATKSEADSTLILLDSDKDIFHLFSLVNLTRSTVQCSILRAFLAMCQLSSAVDMKAKLRQCSAIQVLIPHCGANNPMVRANAIKLMSCLLEGRDDDTSVECVNQTCLENVLSVIKTSNDEEEIAAALGFISLLPTAYTHFTQWLLDARALPIITSFFTNGNQNMSSENHLTENAVMALCRFTISARPDWQKKVADLGVIPTLVRLLGSGSSLTKKHAAISLAQFSESSTELSGPIKRRRGFMCFAAQPETGCLVHNGMCSIESSFCLVEADAVEPLVKLLGDRDSGASEASLLALMTLIDGVKLQSGVKVIAKADGIIPMIRLLSSSSVELQEKCLLVLERVFRLEEMKRNYGALAQTPLVEMTQRGSGNVRASAARILAHLNVLHEQSSYF